MNKKDYVIPTLALLCVSALLMYNPISQSETYHNFVDQRKFLNIPNFFNVITNLPFAVVGLLGLSILKYKNEKELKLIASTLFTGFLFVTLGSGFYHLIPNNETLVYDRIPIVVILMSFFAFIIHDYVNKKSGYIAFIALNAIGILSVIYWIIGEHAGKGDLRWYGMIQFFPVIAIPLILVLYKQSCNYSKQIVLIFLFFALAKFGEMFDKYIYNILNYFISGHSLKHLFMALAGYEMVVMMHRRIKYTS